MINDGIEKMKRDVVLCKMFVALGGECLRDGDMYGAVIGDLPTGCSEFRTTRLAAILACMDSFYNEKAVTPLIRTKGTFTEDDIPF